MIPAARPIAGGPFATCGRSDCNPGIHPGLRATQRARKRRTNPGPVPRAPSGVLPMRTSPRRRHRCPFPDCPSHKKRHSRIVRHGRYGSRRGSRLRLLCRVCDRTFGARRGTVYYRLRSTRDDFDLAMRLQVEGVTQAAAARSVGISVSTIARWKERAAFHARAFEEEHLEVKDPIELQLDELCARGKGSRDEIWLYSGLEVWSRVWAATHVGRRTKRS